MAKELETITQFEAIREDLIIKNEFSCNTKPFSASDEWGVYGGVIRRKDGNFFSITGLKAFSRKEVVPVSECPVIYQPTNAINGFLLKNGSDDLGVLFQARIEPGNTGVVQLAPTVQSTEANYKQLHGGKPTPFINSFLGHENGRVFYRGLQSEEGSRYHGKYNMYVIAEADDSDLAADKDDFFLLGSRQIKEFICLDSVINTDARGLLFFLDWNLLSNDSRAFCGMDNPINRALMESYSYEGTGVGTDVLNAVQFIMQKRASCAIRAEHVRLDTLKNWELTDDHLKEKEGQLGFTVSLYEVQAKHREVAFWDQPLISSDTEGRVVLFGRINQGVMEFLICLDSEIGYLEGVQYTASVSVAPGKKSSMVSADEHLLLAAADSANAEDIIIECLQSEEGGRFHNDINRYQIILTDGDFPLHTPSECQWMTLSQIRKLGNIPSMLSIELRCVLTLLVELA